MLIALDYDNTITKDRPFWLLFADTAACWKHELVVVTGRDVSQPVTFLNVPVVYAGNQLKRDAAEEAGYKVDIWIDDEPGTIERCRKLEWEQ